MTSVSILILQAIPQLLHLLHAAATSSNPSCSESRLDSCSHYLSCVSCVAHEGCSWTQSGCTVRSNDTETSCSVTDGCSGHTSCSSCTGQGNCFWCSSLNKCVDTGDWSLSLSLSFWTVFRMDSILFKHY